MVIDNVSLYGLTTLYDIVCDVYENKEITGKSFGRNLIEIYNQVEIRINIKSLSFIEYFHLKYILQEGNCGPFYWSTDYSMNYIKQVFPEISHEARLLSRAASEEKYSQEDTILLMPSGFIDGKCSVKITGADLTMFFKTNPMLDFFVTIADGEKFQNSDHTFNRPYMYELVKDGLVTDKDLENKIKTKFMEVFYTSVLQNHDYVDLLSDFSISNHYFSDTNKLININNMLNVVTNPDKLLQTIKDIKESSVSMYSIRLSFSLFTDFFTFLVYYSIFPKRCFTAIESLRVPFTSTTVLNDTDDKALVALNDLKEAIASNYAVENKAINLAYMIFNHAPMHFVISITFKDVDMYLQKLKYLNDYEHVKKSYEFIMKYMSNIYNLLKK